jgi:hypothetical protein
MSLRDNTFAPRLRFRLVRQSFFDAVQRRTGARHRLCGLVADEFPLVVCREDIEQLATVRSKGCFVLAATQGLAGIDDQIGERARRAVLQHFNTLIFLRSLEEEVGRLATLTLGLRRESAFQTAVKVARPSDESAFGDRWACAA